MKNLEYAKVMSREEKTSLISYFKNKNESENDLSKSILKNNKDVFIDAYHKYAEKAIEDFENKHSELDKKIELWEQKKCSCGKDLRFITGYDFFGCPDYKNKNKTHLTFSLSQREIFEEQRSRIKISINKDWATDIIRDNGFNGKIKAKQLLLFYELQGLEDLRSKYGYKNTIESISSYVHANNESKKEEQEISDFLHTHFDCVIAQFYIKHKVEGEKEKVSIIDLLVSDDSDVFLIEVKRNTMSVDDEQLSLYYNLIKRIMDDVNDTRTLTPLFIVSNEDGYDDPNDYFFFENFDDVTDTIELKRIMKMFNHLKVK